MRTSTADFKAQGDSLEQDGWQQQSVRERFDELASPAGHQDPAHADNCSADGRRELPPQVSPSQTAVAAGEKAVA